MLHQMHNDSSNAKYSLLKVSLQNKTKLKDLFFYFFFILAMKEFSCVYFIKRIYFVIQIECLPKWQYPKLKLQ